MSSIADAMRRVITGDDMAGKSCVILNAGPSCQVGSADMAGLFEVWEDAASGPLRAKDHTDLGPTRPILGAKPGDFYPAQLREEIEALNARIYATVNNGVYRCGFARTQAAYEEAVTALFATLDDLETRLSTRRFLCGDVLTEADWRLFVTLLRFDAVYVGLFKCNVRRIEDYPHLQRYLLELLRWPGVAETVDMLHIKHHYYESLKIINPTGIVPVGPKLAF